MTSPESRDLLQQRDIEILTGYCGKIAQRKEVLRSLCPCRNNKVDDPDTWRNVLRIATHGSLQERNAAAHSIGTLLIKAKTSEKWRRIVLEVEEDLQRLMDDTRASRSLLGTLKKHGHARKGTARKHYRVITKSLELRTADQLASWLNERLSLHGAKRLTASHPGVQRLATWAERRRKFEPKKRTGEEAVFAQARRLMPTVVV